EGVRVHGGWEVMGQAEVLTEECVKMANKLLTAKYVKGGNVPVLIDQKLGGVFAHEAVGHGCEADCVLQESSVFKEKLGKKVANEKLTLIDDGTKEGFYGWVPLDDEGVEGQKTMLIEDGVLKNFLHSRETATRMKMLPTGNGRAESLGNPVIPRMRCTYIEKGNDKFEDMLKEIKDGYYLKGTLGGEVNPSTGEFLFNAQYGYKVKNGEIKEMVKAVSLGGSILEILPKIKMIGKDLDFSQGTCGKGGQSVPVSDGAPHMLIEKAKVGGK
ncbi:MAG: TldD/PmbA family protein, partial [Candidatus Nanoarchaeia archaeon]